MTAGRSSAGAGGIVDTGGTAGGGAAGAAGRLDRELHECTPLPSTRGPCNGGCTLNAAFATSCPSPLSLLAMAESTLLVDHARGSDLFGLHVEGGLISFGRWNDAALSPLLTHDGTKPVVVHPHLTGSIVVDPGPVAGPQGTVAFSDRVLDVGYDASTLRVLGSSDDGVALWSIGADGAVSSEPVADVREARLVVGSSPPWIVGVRDSAGASLIRGDVVEPVDLGDAVYPSALSAVAIGDRAVIASLRLGEGGGVVVVWDDGVTRTFGAARSLSCPAGYTANYPNVCEFETVPEVSTSGAILAAMLVVNRGEPWLVSIVGDVTDRCETFTGGCFETLPCDCSYRRAGSAVRTELRLESLDDASRAFSIGLNDFPYESVRLAASGSREGAIFVAVAEGKFTPGGSHADTAIDYLMITP